MWGKYKRLMLWRAACDFIAAAAMITIGLHLNFIGSKNLAAVFFCLGVVFIIFTAARLMEFRDE